MNDKIFFIATSYLLLSILISGFLPSELYTGTHFNTENEMANFNTGLDGSSLETGNMTAQLNFFQKILTFLFVSWNIEDIPVLVATSIFVLNIFSIFITVIWIYDKVRGIGS